MKSPFQFGRVVVGDTFTDRNSEIRGKICLFLIFHTPLSPTNTTLALV